ncbi:unnamed protein product [Cochlearia groenlandica]
MMSTISPVYSYEPGLVSSVSAFETGFTPWDISSLSSLFNYSSITPIPNYPNPGSVDNYSNQTGSNISPADNTDDHRRKKRKLSNRESAKRSRMKKQKHLEDMNFQLNRLKIENRELVNQLRYVLNHCQLAKKENDRLRVEHRVLLDKLFNIRQVIRSNGALSVPRVPHDL